MKNIEVARCFISNALAYAKDGHMDVVIENLKLLRRLLEKPDEENQKYSWEDFK